MRRGCVMDMRGNEGRKNRRSGASDAPGAGDDNAATPQGGAGAKTGDAVAEGAGAAASADASEPAASAGAAGEGGTAPEATDSAGTPDAADDTESGEAGPVAEFSRLDTVLARLIGRKDGPGDKPRSPPVPAELASNDNAGTDDAGAPATADADPAKLPAGEAVAEAPDEASGEDDAPDAPDAAESASPPEAETTGEAAPDAPPSAEAAEQAPDQADTGPAVPPAEGPGEAGPGDDAEPEPARASQWPDQWGTPTAPNVLRVLGELMADLDARNAGDGDGASETPAEPAKDERGSAVMVISDAAPAPPAPGDDAAEPPPRPVLGPPTADAPSPSRPVLPPPAPPAVRTGESGQGKPEVVAPPAVPPAAPETPAKAEAVAPSGGGDAETSDSGTPNLPAPAPKAVKAVPQHHSQWMLDQPEFRRSFGRAPAVLISSAPEPDVEPLPDGDERGPDDVLPAAGRRMLRIVAACGALVVLGVAGYLLNDARTPAVTPATVGPQAVANEPRGESLLPRPAQPRPALPRATAPPTGQETETSQEVAIAAPDTGSLDRFATFTPLDAPDGQGPTITIERTSVRPFAPGSPRAIASTRFDSMNLAAARHIATYDIEPAERIVDDILSRDPAHFGALLSRGRIHLLRDEFAAAEKDFVDARAVKPNSFAAALGEVEALLGERRGQEALDKVEAAIAANPGEPAALDLRARAHAMTGAVDMITVDCAELSWKLGVSYVGKWCEAMAYKDAGRTEDAVEAFRTAIADANEEFISHRQRYLHFRGLYDGEIDGEAGPATTRALVACASDPNC